MRTEVVLWSAGAAPTSIPVEVTAETTVVAAATGPPRSRLRVRERERQRVRPRDARSPQLALAARARRRRAGSVPARDAVGRAVGPACATRDSRRQISSRSATARAPERTRRANRRGRRRPSEPRDVDVPVGRAARAHRHRASRTCCCRSRRTRKRTYGIRKNYLDTYISVATSAGALARLRAWLDSASIAGTPLRQPTRWSIVTHLVERGAADGDALITAEARRDTTVNGRRSAFVAGAARPQPAVKAEYFNRFFHDSTLNEDWVTASLRAFNAPDQSRGDAPLPRSCARLARPGSRRTAASSSSARGSAGSSADSSRRTRCADIDDFLAQHRALPHGPEAEDSADAG